MVTLLAVLSSSAIAKIRGRKEISTRNESENVADVFQHITSLQIFKQTFVATKLCLGNRDDISQGHHVCPYSARVKER